METRSSKTTQQKKVRTGEINSGELVTVPNMSVSVRQLLINHSRGHQLEKVKGAQYGVEQPIIRDFTDIEDMAEQLEETRKDILTRHEQEMQANKEAKQKADELKQKQQEFEEFLQKQKEPDKGS